MLCFRIVNQSVGETAIGKRVFERRAEFREVLGAMLLGTSIYRDLCCAGGRIKPIRMDGLRLVWEFRANFLTSQEI